MQSRFILKIFFGFVLAAVLAFGPPLTFLSIPGAGFFFLLLPLWSIGAVILLFFGFLVFGRIPYAIGVALLAFAAAVSPIGKLGKSAVGVVTQAVDTNKFIMRELNEKCRANIDALKTASAKYDLIVFDDIGMNGEQNYDITDTVAVLTGMRVVQISRMGHEGLFFAAWETRAEKSSSCAGGRDRTEVRVSPRGSQRKIAPLAVDMCISRTKIADPSQDQTPAIVFKRIRSGAIGCDATEVVERMGSGDVDLGRVHYDSYHHRFYPDLTLPEGVPKDNWLHVLLTEVLQQDFSDAALKSHAANANK